MTFYTMRQNQLVELVCAWHLSSIIKNVIYVIYLCENYVLWRINHSAILQNHFNSGCPQRNVCSIESGLYVACPRNTVHTVLFTSYFVISAVNFQQWTCYKSKYWFYMRTYSKKWFMWTKFEWYKQFKKCNTSLAKMLKSTVSAG